MAPVALTCAVLDASGSTSQLGLVLAARMVPLLAFSLVGGATVLIAEPAGSDLDFRRRRACRSVKGIGEFRQAFTE
jgi:hypothetical protein